MKNVFIGIDVSKDKLDICVLKEKEIITELELSNSTSELKKFFEKSITTFLKK